MQVDKDERALQDVIMYGELAAMGIEIETDEEQVTHALSDNELEKILEDDSQTEEMDTFIMDSNIDACRVKSGSMPGKCIIDFVYLFNNCMKNLTTTVAE
ncbi:unnamed protein product [Lasius platythorax]|uniref:Uncharacterized protein n=1 Tax=Lasius platythorax TaxID=488582 RepID=A0AAV2MYC7_9HYME